MDDGINLYVDDIRRCPDGFVVARNYDEAIQLLKTSAINILSLDHDLGIDDNGV
nr:cyclic-phosphate processing receiver domain-containing protein [Clostridium botulinum]